jgi:quercetin dioxygenase-like cupin family protein
MIHRKDIAMHAPSHPIVPIALALGLCVVAAPAALGQHATAHHTMIVPSEIKWSDVPSLPPGAKIAVIEGPMNQAVPITARIKFPANYRLPAHTHPVIEHVTVISGTFHMGAGDKLDTAKTTALPAGGFAIMAPGTPHFAWTSEETVVQVHSVGPWGITYVNPADDPRKK